MRRKINLLLLLFSLVGGAVGFVVGEILLNRLPGDLPGMVIIGLYFGILALCIGVFCLVAEMTKPRLNGSSWRQRYVGASWKLVVPATLVMVFVVGLALEFVYELNLGGLKQVKNIVFVIDDSGSMEASDPDNSRYGATKMLINKMDQDKEAAIIVFDDRVQLIQPFVRLKDQGVKEEVFSRLDGLEPMQGGTNIDLALTEAMDQIKSRNSSSRGTLVILLSDGYSEVDTANALSEYKKDGIAINAIGLGLDNAEGSALLKEIAAQTGGQYQDVAEADQLTFAFQKIYDNIGERTLVTKRTGPTEDSGIYMALRILSILLIGAVIGLGLGIMFDNRYLAKSFSIGGAAGGILAGLLLEFGLSGEEFIDVIVRLLACLLLAGVIALFTLVVPVKENQGRITGRRRNGHNSPASNGIGERPRDGVNRGF